MITLPLEATIEEFEQGTWVADLVLLGAFDGNFPLPDGSVWTGTAVESRLDRYKYYCRVVGGQANLGATLPDKFYSGNVSLQVAVGDVCTAAGETIGSVTPGIFLSTFMRLEGTAAQALDSIADAFDQIWWIDRTGLVNMAPARPVGQPVDGLQVLADTDGSVILQSPNNLTLGAAYAPQNSDVPISQIRHIRWHYSEKRFSSQVYPQPLIFFQPENISYSCIYDAIVTSDNGDGTVDLIGDGRFSVSNAKLLCGVPGSKVLMQAGDECAVGWFGANPQKPYALLMAQNSSAIKAVAREQDSVNVGSIELIVGGSATLSGTYTAPNGTTTPIATGTPFAVSGLITSGTSRISIGD